MTKVNTGISIDKEVKERNDEIREAIREQDPFGRDIDRSELVEQLLDEWNEEHAHVLEDDGDRGQEADTGNRAPIPAAD